MLQNELKSLAIENKRRIQYVTAEDRQVMQRLLRYLNWTKFSAFEAEIMKKDLIGMALESYQRHQSLATVIGDDEEGFCKQMTEGCKARPFKEQFLQMATEISFCWFLYALVSPLVYGSPIPFAYETLGFLFLWTIIFCFCQHYLDPIFAFKKGLWKTLPFIFRMLLLLTILWIPETFREATVFTVHPALFILFFFVLWLTFNVLNNQYIHKTASNYRWQD